MTTTEMILGGLVLLSLSSSSRAARARRDALNNPTTWGSDMWSRIYGEDLARAGLVHDTQSSLTAYGFDGAIGFSTRQL
jgi:hypothetical protein